MNRVTGSVLVAVGGVVLGIGATCLGTNHQITHLKQVGDSVKTAAVVRDSVTTVWADSMARVVDSLQRAKRPVTIKISIDSATAAAASEAVRKAKTPRDSNVAYAVQVRAQADEIHGLRLNAVVDSLSFWKAMARGDSLQTALHMQTKSIINLNAEIQRLNSHRLPGWARTSLEVARTGLAIWKVTDLVLKR